MQWNVFPTHFALISLQALPESSCLPGTGHTHTHTHTHTRACAQKDRHVWKADYDISPFFFFPFRRLSGGTMGVPSPLRTMFCATFSATGPSVITVLL